MSIWSEALLISAVLLASGSASAQAAYPGIGRAATPSEVAAWDIDVRPDFLGLPPGAGSVAAGQVVWEARCASCHGIFGESNEVFSPLVGGTTAADVARGRVARLDDAGFPGRTTLMKLSTVSTLWDYIRRAMPWNQPKSLSSDEVYAVTAYLLNLGGIVADGFVLTDTNIGAVQQRLPNRHGTTTAHGLWPGKGMGNGGLPDVRAVACMSRCESETRVASFIPEHARNQHGNLALQQRSVGPQRGVDTGGPPLTTAAARPQAEALALAQKHHCTACHGVERRIVGPGLREIAVKYAGRSDAESYLAGRIQAGGQGVWGSIAMPAQTLPAADLKRIAQWLVEGAMP
jgi:S-disulfanyl-L-cysteine oxidoreductase SoxD